MPCDDKTCDHGVTPGDCYFCTPTNLCQGCWKPSDYVYCEECAKTARCLHNNPIADCVDCDFEGDLAFDSAREGR